MANKKHICPICGGKQFITSAHVAQDWKVDENGNFIQLIQDATEVVAFPDDDNIWTCAECGSEAMILEEAVEELPVIDILTTAQYRNIRTVEEVLSDLKINSVRYSGNNPFLIEEMERFLSGFPVFLESAVTTALRTIQLRLEGKG